MGSESRTLVNYLAHVSYALLYPHGNLCMSMPPETHFSIQYTWYMTCCIVLQIDPKGLPPMIANRVMRRNPTYIHYMRRHLLRQTHLPTRDGRWLPVQHGVGGTSASKVRVKQSSESIPSHADSSAPVFVVGSQPVTVQPKAQVYASVGPAHSPTTLTDQLDCEAGDQIYTDQSSESATLDFHCDATQPLENSCTDNFQQLSSVSPATWLKQDK